MKHKNEVVPSLCSDNQYRKITQHKFGYYYRSLHDGREEEEDIMYVCTTNTHTHDTPGSLTPLLHPWGGKTRGGGMVCSSGKYTKGVGSDTPSQQRTINRATQKETPAVDTAVWEGGETNALRLESLVSTCQRLRQATGK